MRSYLEKLLLIDGHSILHRAFYGMPDLTNASGVHTGAVYGFLNILFKLLDEETPDYLTVAFDVHAPTFRHQIYEAYKGTRKPMPPELREQVPLLKKVLEAMDIACCEQAGLEADDILGTLAKKSEKEGRMVTLVSGDRDLLQIATDNILIRIPKTAKGQTTIENYYAEDVVKECGVTPLQFIEVKALMGDKTDNIPGVPKVGVKTATELIQKFGSVDGVYAHLDEIPRKLLREGLQANEDSARLSLTLATIKTDAPVELDKDKAAVTNFYTPAAFALFHELGFRKYLDRFDMDAMAAKEEEKELPVTVIEDLSAAESCFAGILRKVQEGQGEENNVCLHILPDQPKKNILGLAVMQGEECFYFCPEGFITTPYLSCKLGEIRKAITTRYISMHAAKESMHGKSESEKTPKNSEEQGNPEVRENYEKQCDKSPLLICFDLKNLYPFLDVEEEELTDGIHMEGIQDLLLGAYLVNPLKSDYMPEDIAGEYLHRTAQSWKELFDKKTPEQVMEERPADGKKYICRTAQILQMAASPVFKELERLGMSRLYEQIELPLTYVLYDMERLGIRTEAKALADYSLELEKKIRELEDKIHQETGNPIFNISSPKQLGEVLFEQMMLPGGKKTKTGYSTSADILEKLAPEYPVVADILEYRALSKLKSTYADGLYTFIKEDGRIHSTFHQTITATGRLSSADPNLQNIPMRTENGRLIRKAFLPKDGYFFADADYSQIELRILAHMSGDEELIEAYRQNQDIHRITASKVFHIPFEEVTPLQRRNAKAVNFGIVYGISSFGLSQDLSISRAEAKEYIDAYFETYPGIKKFLDRMVEEAKENGCVTTLFGRRRPVPELKSSNFMQRSFGERIAMNSPIQGTAADIIKIAMIKVFETLHRQGMKSQMILQIHDELLIETDPSEKEQVEKLLHDCMKEAADLRVALETEVHTGSSWYEAK